MSLKIQPFDGSSDVKVYIQKTELAAALKDYDDEKLAQLLGSNLNPPAFDVYMRLSDDEKKDPNAIKRELLKEFEKAEINREEALKELNNRRLLSEESLDTFSYKILALVKLAYKDFTANVQATIAKDYLIKALSTEMQVAVKSIANYESKTIQDLVKEITRLEVAGVKARSSTLGNNCSVMSVSEQSDLVQNITDNVVKSIQELHLSDTAVKVEQQNKTKREGEDEEVAVEFVRGSRGYSGRYRGRSRTSSNYRSERRRSSQELSSMQCRSCNDLGHGFRNCPQRFCQACGKRGHDAWNTDCPQYKL